MTVKQHHIQVGDLRVGNNLPLIVIAGPCQMESRQHTLDIAGKLADISNALGVGMIFKTSFDKANRTSVDSARGLGLEEAAPIFNEVRNKTGLPTLTDIHTAEQCGLAAAVVDVLQIPAFLCRQTDLLRAAAATGKPINVKKGQFLAPWDMANVVKKITNDGNLDVMLCERGVSFGYNTLIADMRSLAILASTGHPVVFDATHSVQQPGGHGITSGGQRQFAPVLARAAVAIGVAAIFIETHQDPDNAPSDGPNMIPISDLKDIIEMLIDFDIIAKRHPIMDLP
ncbi:MAG: 3-deoxy-8-phosphooctulonate synthase [Rhodospirillaceae bacterium TMED8]|nr:3-deoxy-8-phosphooctulonate synthase [Magnetovibrio sp.]OUT51627.1 MAG: 3-deoxy-8-phosphooctulonate synthase [Rhodospirillaceae bacterium TMED8]